MSKLLSTLHTIFDRRTVALERIATALERIAPAIDEPVEVKPDDAVTYVDEAKMAQREEAESLNAVRQWLETHPESADDEEIARESI